MPSAPTQTAQRRLTTPASERVDTIDAFADTNGNGTRDSNEFLGTATKTWTTKPPTSVVLDPPSRNQPHRHGALRHGDGHGRRQPPAREPGGAFRWRASTLRRIGQSQPTSPERPRVLLHRFAAWPRRPLPPTSTRITTAPAIRRSPRSLKARPQRIGRGPPTPQHHDRRRDPRHRGRPRHLQLRDLHGHALEGRHQRRDGRLRDRRRHRHRPADYTARTGTLTIPAGELSGRSRSRSRATRSSRETRPSASTSPTLRQRHDRRRPGDRHDRRRRRGADPPSHDQQRERHRGQPARHHARPSRSRLDRAATEHRDGRATRPRRHRHAPRPTTPPKAARSPSTGRELQAACHRRVHGDTLVESDETFRVNLSGASPTPRSSTPRPRHDRRRRQDPPALTISNASVTEGNPPGTTPAPSRSRLDAPPPRP